MTHYETLGVPRDATEHQIRRAYRKLAARMHPDKIKNPTAADQDRMGKVNAAYAVLSDPKKRKAYDEGRDPDEEEQLRVAVIEYLRAHFQAALSGKSNPLAFVKEANAQTRTAAATRIVELGDQAMRLRARRPLVGTQDDKPNLFHQLVDNELQAIDAQIGTLRRAVTMCNEAEKVLAGDYVDLTPMTPADTRTAYQVLLGHQDPRPRPRDQFLTDPWRRT